MAKRNVSAVSPLEEALASQKHTAFPLQRSMTHAE
jgi:hypothetical protein